MPDNSRGFHPSMPDVEPSRGDHQSSSASTKRSSKSRGSKSSSNRRYSSPYRSSNTSKSEKNPTRGEHSPRRSGGGSSRRRRPSTSKTRESTSKSDKLRLSSGGAAEEIRSPPLLSSHSKSATTSSSGKEGNSSSTRFSKRTSKFSRYSKKTPDSKHNSQSSKTSTLRIAESGPIADPPVLNATATSVNDSVLRGGQDISTVSSSQGIHNNNNNTPSWAAPPLEATAAPDEDEIEAARQQGREEGRNERQNEEQGQHWDDKIVVVAERDSPKCTIGRKCAMVSLIVIVAVAAAIVVWRVMLVNKNSKSDIGPAIGPAIGPSPDDCLAVAQGLAVPAQNNETSSVRSYVIEINFAVTSNTDLALLQGELEIRTQRYVLPLLIGCGIDDGPISIDNIKNFVIANAKLQTATMSSRRTCNLGSQSLCSLAYMEVDLFLKNPQVSSDSILELVSFVFQHEGLLELLDLATPIETIETQREYEALESSPSSIAPTLEPTPLPTVWPTRPPISLATPSPTLGPTTSLSALPTTALPSSSPTTPLPTFSPSPGPTLSPSSQPTTSPTKPCFQTNDELWYSARGWMDPDTHLTNLTKETVEAQYGPIENWCFGPGVTSMKELFRYGRAFNADISNWDVSGITDMYAMFYINFAFNQDLSRWNVSSVTDMKWMFYYASAFNQNIGSWNVSSVTNTEKMFYEARSFNQDIGKWDVSNLKITTSMFENAIAFNQDLSNWTLSSLERMDNMFSGASDFNQNLCAWASHVPTTANVTNSFESTRCPLDWTPDLDPCCDEPQGPFCNYCA